MSYAEDPRIFEAKAIPVRDLVDRLGIAGLKPASGEMVGPCPLCGGRDRFGIVVKSSVYNCRGCGIRGGDQIALVQDVLGLDFRAALQWLCGDAPAAIDPKEQAHRRAKAEAARRKQDDYSARARDRARQDAQRIWRSAVPGQDCADLKAYLEARGLGPALDPFPRALRFLPDHPYVKSIRGQLTTQHRGPCMIAVILRPNGSGGAVHQTWIDPARPGKKARVLLEGAAQPAKMVRGSKKGNAIRLITPAGADTLVMGEGIETTLSAAAVGACPGAAYWAGVDLGNMAGRMERIEGVKWSGRPDMGDAEAFVPPPWVRRLIFIQDGDSHPKATRAKLESGLKRAMALRPGLKAQIVQAGDGVDLNDVLVGAGAEAGGKV